uniref:NADH-ubiquinone oxidoreductase chain 6 n=1 Tax=Oedalechilus labiosus TaxID=1111468 RepID=A0A0U1XRS3_OEDLA|nr:NADH dehydrogenase subunit 6 [Oedalechilus labiosus]AIY61263.1 NADH dehydrogenase subunit 6 [Oedalechilus labiosus]
MTIMTVAFLFGLVVGLAAVASNPSPYFAALGLVMAAGMGCGILVVSGGPFLSLVLVLIYLGGMLVVFAYSAALAAEPYPESWESRPVLETLLLYLGGVFLAGLLFWGQWNWGFWFVEGEQDEMGMVGGDVGGVALLYSTGGAVLIISGWVLLLTLFVVLELTRGLDRGALRAV